jgi:hypothetical protein
MKAAREHILMNTATKHILFFGASQHHAGGGNGKINK